MDADWLALIQQSTFGHVLSNRPLYDVRVIVAICPQQRRYKTAHVGNAVTVTLDR